MEWVRAVRTLAWSTAPAKKQGQPSPSAILAKLALPTINTDGWSRRSCECSPAMGWPIGPASNGLYPLLPTAREDAISCHNCYTGSLTGTVDKLHAAQSDGADLLELDIKDEGGTVYVEHDDTGGTSGPHFSDVLADASLKSGNQILFIELKETNPTVDFVTSVLDQLAAEGFGVSGPSCRASNLPFASGQSSHCTKAACHCPLCVHAQPRAPPCPVFRV